MRRSNARTPALDHQSNPPKMDSLKPQFRSTPNRHNFPRKHLKSNLFIFLSLLITLLVFLISRAYRISEEFKPHFKIFIDGGSTGTRIHVFKVNVGSDGLPSFDFGKDGLASLRVGPGLSSFARDPAGAGRSLLELLEFGRGKVPRSYWGGTEIRLMATAGLRRLEVGDQEKILESCRSVLRASGFRFQDDWASVITGSDEGIYAWVAANYALGTLGGDPQKTVGIVELGGASAQVTLVSSEPVPPEFAHSLKYGQITYNLYSHSLLDLGQSVAHDSLRELLLTEEWKSTESDGNGILLDPCTPKGYTHNMESWNLSPGALKGKKKSLPTLRSRGNFSECRTAALQLLQKGKAECSYQHCHIGNTYIPELRGKLLATENFFYTSKFFGLPQEALLSDLMLAGQHFCGEDWSKLQKKYTNLDEEDLLRYCFSSAYIVALLHDSLGIPLNDGRIGFTNQVGNIPLDWALGAFIMQIMTDLDRHSNWIHAILHGDSAARFSLFIISIIVICIAWSIMKWRKPQYKTIYDLEKGRYIITHVPR